MRFGASTAGDNRKKFWKISEKLWIQFLGISRTIRGQLDTR